MGVGYLRNYVKRTGRREREKGRVEVLIEYQRIYFQGRPNQSVMELMNERSRERDGLERNDRMLCLINNKRCTTDRVRER